MENNETKNVPVAEKIVGRRIASNMCKLLVNQIDGDAESFIARSSKGVLETTDFDPQILVEEVKRQLVTTFTNIVEQNLNAWIQDFSDSM